MATPVDLDLTASAEQRRLTGLRRMKALATSLFLLAAVTYAATVDRAGGWAWVNAAAEAAMVGALADWFAVTALFRHPLGLPIPHTALIPKRKQALGESLQDFVATHFLVEDIVRDKVARAEVANRVGAWLAEPDHARSLTGHASIAAAAALRAVRDEDLAALLDQVVIQRAFTQEWSGPAGRLLAQMVSDGSHERLVELGLGQLRQWLLDNEPAVTAAVLERSPGWTPRWVDRRIARRAYLEAVDWVADAESDPHHRVRVAVNNLLARFAEDLQHDPHTRARAEDVLRRLLSHPEVRAAITGVWSAVRRMLIDAIEDPDGELRRRVAEALAALGRRLQADGGLRAAVDARLVDAAGFAVRAYGSEIATVISETVQRWDGAEAARRIELHVGRDLQFIRINGTVVGALAGLAIHAATVLT